MSKVLTDQIEKRTGGTAMDLPATGKWPIANIADDAIGAAQLADNAVTNAKMADDAVGIAELSATGTAQAGTYLQGDNSWGAISSEDSVKVLSKSGDYTILPADVSSVGTLYVLVDASAATRTITLPTPANYSGVVIKIVTTVDPGTNSVIVNNSSAAELWTMYELGDFYEVISDGTNNKKVAGHTSIYGYIITVTASQYAGTGGIVNMFDASSSVQSNVGGFWDSTTDYRVEVPADFGTGIITLGSVLIGNGSISAAFYKDGASLYNPVAGEYAGGGGRTIITPCVGGNTFNHMAKGTHAGVNYLFYGGGPPADSTYGWFKIERYT